MTDATFTSLFGASPQQQASAPGRVNLIGEHTDYNDGFAMPAVIPLQTRVWLALRSGPEVRVASDTQHGPVLGYTLGTERRRGDWLDYVQGVTWALRRAGYRTGGFDLLITSDVPVGKGLSSSAALEVAVLRGLRALCGLTISDLEIAQLAHVAETQLVGAPVGVMDQMACSLGVEGCAFLLDASTREHEDIPLPADTSLRIIDSGIAHHHASGNYRVRRHECDEAARLLRVTSLRQLTTADLPRVAKLPDPLNRRVRHVVTENARVLDAAAALRAGDLQTFGTLLTASHASLRDDFEVSIAEIDWLVDIATGNPDVLGARLTGGGFGGAILLVCLRSAPRDTAARIVREYRALCGKPADVLIA